MEARAFASSAIGPRLTQSIVLLIARFVPASRDAPAAANAVFGQLFGDPMIAFGDLETATEARLTHAFERAKVDFTSVGELRTLSQLLMSITPTTPICGSCGLPAINVVGGKIFAPPAGAACLFACDTSATTDIEIVTLRKVAWTDGRLVEPQMDFDLRIIPGERIPLNDDEIKAWCDGNIDRSLQRALEAHGVPLYGFLAYHHLVAHTFGSPREARNFLKSTSLAHFYTFGDTDPARLLEADILEAAWMLHERELRNTEKYARGIFLAKRAGWKQWTIGSEPFLIEGRLGVGSKSTVYRGRWAHNPTQGVIIKALDEAAEADMLAREAAVLTALANLEVTAADEVYRRRVHQIFLERSIAVDETGAEREALVFVEKPAYQFTLDELLDADPAGALPSRHVAWLGKRLLEFLGWLHRVGYVHRCLLPEHLLVNARDHQIALLDFSYAAKISDRMPLRTFVEKSNFYPEEARRGDVFTPAMDIAMACRVLIHAHGGNPATGELPTGVTIDAMTEFLVKYAGYAGVVDVPDSYALSQEFSRAVKTAHGKPVFHELAIPPALGRTIA